MQWRMGRTILVALLALVAVTAFWAQGSTGAISGRVVDAKGEPIPGAQVTITSSFLQGAKGTATNVDGEFFVPYLAPGNDYKVTVEAAGFNKVIQSNVVVSLGGTSTMQIGLMSGGQEIQVTAQAPAVSLKDTKLSTNLTQAELETLPLTRDYQDILYLAPSVVGSGEGGNPGVSGSSGAENIFLINGLNTTDPVTGTFGSNLNYNFIREMEVTTGGMEAEYGGSTGGLFNVLTKSGTNEFHGEIFGYYSNQNFNANAQSTDLTTVNNQPYHNYDYGFDVGGPIVKDKLWFFVGYNPAYYSTTYNGTSHLTNIWGAGPTQINIPYLYDDTSRNWFWSAKLNWRINEKHSLELSAFGDPSHMWFNEGSGGDPVLQDTARMTRRYQGGLSGNLKWFATWSNKFFMETSLGAYTSILDILPWEHSGYNQVAVYDWDYSPTLSIGKGIGYVDQGKRDLPFQLSSKGTYLANNHEIKFGFEYTTKKWTEFYGPSGGQTWYVYLHNGDGSGFPTTNVNDYAYWRVDWLQNPNVDNKGTYGALFVQDKWSVTPYVTLSYGLRWEQDQLQPQNGQHWSVSDLSPRIGVTWDWARNGKSKFYASWGDYFERPPLAATNEMDAGHASYENRYYGGAKYESLITSNTPAYVFGGTTNQSVQETIAGMAYELKPDLTLDVRGTWRQIGHVLEDAGYLDAQGNLSYVLMNPGSGQYPAAFSAWANQKLANGAPFDYQLASRPIRNYSAYTVTLLKRFSNHWFLNGSYTYSMLKGNYGGGRGYYGGDMNITQAYDIPESTLNKNTYGWLAQDIRTQIKVQTSYTFDFGLVLGANLFFRTGLPYNAYTPYPYYESYYGTIYYTPLGSQRLPSVWSFDLHAEYDFKIYKSALGLFLDIFNLTNNQGITSVYETRWKQPNYMTQILDGSWYANAANLDPNYGRSTGRQSPRSARVGIKWSF